jgi:hypothetical protein
VARRHREGTPPRIADLHVIIDTGSLVARTRNHNQAFTRHAGRSVLRCLDRFVKLMQHHTSTYIRAYTIIIDGTYIPTCTGIRDPSYHTLSLRLQWSIDGFP